jgi:hypothetical protein
MKGFILGIKKEIAVNCSIRKSTINYNLDHSVYYRNSKDSVINSRGKALIDIINYINGEFTFVNKNGSSSIDLCLINNSFQTDNLDFQVLDYESSCHFPMSFCKSLPNSTIHIH